MNKQKTGALIAAIRKEKGLTQEQLGEKLYVTGKAVSKWERGDSAPGIDLLEPLARVLGITVTEREDRYLDILEVMKGSPADSAGMEPGGIVIRVATVTAKWWESMAFTRFSSTFSAPPAFSLSM